MMTTPLLGMFSNYALYTTLHTHVTFEVTEIHPLPGTYNYVQNMLIASHQSLPLSDLAELGHYTHLLEVVVATRWN